MVRWLSFELGNDHNHGLISLVLKQSRVESAVPTSKSLQLQRTTTWLVSSQSGLSLVEENCLAPNLNLQVHPPTYITHYKWALEVWILRYYLTSSEYFFSMKGDEHSLAYMCVALPPLPPHTHTLSPSLTSCGPHVHWQRSASLPQTNL